MVTVEPSGARERNCPLINDTGRSLVVSIATATAASAHPPCKVPVAPPNSFVTWSSQEFCRLPGRKFKRSGSEEPGWSEVEGPFLDANVRRLIKIARSALLDGTQSNFQGPS